MGRRMGVPQHLTTTVKGRRDAISYRFRRCSQLGQATSLPFDNEEIGLIYAGRVK